MVEHAPKPRILRSKRGVAVLLVLIVAIFALIYVATGATAFLRTTQQPEPARVAGAPR